ncbi:MAG: envelope stress response membrane protein PspB [Vibrio sp.]
MLFFLGPLMIFLLFVAPLWLVLHYRSKRKFTNNLSEDDVVQLTLLSQQARQLDARIRTLEQILDSEAPQWRQHYE